MGNARYFATVKNLSDAEIRRYLTAFLVDGVKKDSTPRLWKEIVWTKKHDQPFPDFHEVQERMGGRQLSLSPEPNVLDDQRDIGTLEYATGNFMRIVPTHLAAMINLTVREQMAYASVRIFNWIREISDWLKTCLLVTKDEIAHDFLYYGNNSSNHTDIDGNAPFANTHAVNVPGRTTDSWDNYTTDALTYVNLQNNIMMLARQRDMDGQYLDNRTQGYTLLVPYQKKHALDIILKTAYDPVSTVGSYQYNVVRQYNWNVFEIHGFPNDCNYWFLRSGKANKNQLIGVVFAPFQIRSRNADYSFTVNIDKGSKTLTAKEFLAYIAYGLKAVRMLSWVGNYAS